MRESNQPLLASQLDGTPPPWKGQGSTGPGRTQSGRGLALLTGTCPPSEGLQRLDPQPGDLDDVTGPREHPHGRGPLPLHVCLHAHAHIHIHMSAHTHIHTRTHCSKLSIVEWTIHRGKSFIFPLPDIYTVRFTSPLNSRVCSQTAGLGVSADAAEEMVRVGLQGSGPGICCQPAAAQRREPQTQNYDTERIFCAGHGEGLRTHGSGQRVLLFKMKIRHSLQGQCCYHPETQEDRSHGQLVSYIAWTDTQTASAHRPETTKESSLAHSLGSACRHRVGLGLKATLRQGTTATVSEFSTAHLGSKDVKQGLNSGKIQSQNPYLVKKPEI